MSEVASTTFASVSGLYWPAVVELFTSTTPRILIGSVLGFFQEYYPFFLAIIGVLAFFYIARLGYYYKFK